MFVRIGVRAHCWKYTRSGLGLLLILIAGCATQPGATSSSAPALSQHANIRADRDTAQQQSTTGTRQRQVAETPTRGAGNKLQLAEDAPRRYTVKKGDTLWDLAALFLNDPWHWPQLWAQNPDIKNPNLIYPGETLVLTRTFDGRLRLRPAAYKRLEPEIRAKPLAAAVPAIPDHAIRIFLEGDRIVAAHLLENAPHIVAFGDARPSGTRGQKAFIKGLEHSSRVRYQIVRPAGPVKDPVSGRVYGIKVQNVGELRIVERGRMATAIITSSNRIALAGDRLIPLPTQPLNHGYHPHPPDTSIKARVIGLPSGHVVASQYQILTISAGAIEGLDRGAVLEIMQPGRMVADPLSGHKTRLPFEEVGTVMVFKTGPHYAFGLVTQVEEAVNRGYLVRSPTQ